MANLSNAAEAAKPERITKAHRPKAVASADKVIASVIRASLEKRKTKANMTVSLYSLKTKNSPFGLPFCAINDDFALSAQKQIAPTCDCYKIGSFCLLDGSLSRVKPYVLLDKGVL